MVKDNLKSPKSKPSPGVAGVPCLSSSNDMVLRPVTLGDRNSLPSLYSNNSIENPKTTSDSSTNDHIQALCGVLTPYHKRAAQTLYSNVERLISKVAKSVNHVGFLTLTFPDNVTDHKEAYRRFRSFNTNFLSKHQSFGEWVSVKERQERGAWHYHLVITLEDDIRTGVNFEEITNGKYTSAGKPLRDLWKQLREALPEYGMGRSELLPIQSNKEAMARYIGKYISKHMGQRDEDDKGVRLVNYSRNWTKNSVNFAWNTENAKKWRKKLKLFAKLNDCQELYQLTEKLGTGWAYRYAQDIYDIEEKICEIKDKEEKVFQSPTLSRIEAHRDANKARMKRDLTLHSGKTSRQRKIEKSKTIAKNIVAHGVKEWMTDERTERIYQEIDWKREEWKMESAFDQKQALERMILGGKTFDVKSGTGETPF